MTLSKETIERINKDAGIYAENNKWFGSMDEIGHSDLKEWDKAAYIEGATTEAKRAKDEREKMLVEVLKDIAAQKTCEEQEADEQTPIGSDGTRLGDIEYGYDCIIKVARKALEGVKEVEG